MAGLDYTAHETDLMELTERELIVLTCNQKESSDLEIEWMLRYEHLQDSYDELLEMLRQEPKPRTSAQSKFPNDLISPECDSRLV